jgi:hypothetical protein
MNGKKAKALRKAVRLTTAVENSYVRNSLQKEKIRFDTDDKGNPAPVAYVVTAVTIRLKVGCQRHWYKRLKKVYKALDSSKKAVVATKIGEFTYAQA